MAGDHASTRTILGVTLAGGRPSRAALYQPLLRCAVAMEWETALARLAAAAGEATIGVVSPEQEPGFGDGGCALPCAVRWVAVEPHLALFFAGIHDGAIDTRQQGTFAFVEWDAHGLEVCVVEVLGGATRLMARSGVRELRTAALAERVAVEVVLPATAGVGIAGVWSGIEDVDRRRILAAGEQLLRRCWRVGRARFSCVLPPMPRVRALARGAVATVDRDQILAQCRLALSDVVDQLHGALDDAGVSADTPVQVIVSGEVARWQELQAALGRMRGVAAVVAPSEPECFAARGAAVAAARDAGVLAKRPA